MRIRILATRLYALCLALSLFAPGTSQALSFAPNSVVADGQICASATVFSCFTPLFQTAGASSVTGGSLDISGTTLTFSIDVALTSLSGSDGAITAVDLTNVNYSGSFSVIDTGTSYDFQDQSTAISGTAVPTGAGSAAAIAAGSVNTTGTCTGTPGVSLVCGFLFGPSGFAIDLDGTTRYGRQSVDLFAVPEPTTAMLIGLGLATLSAAGRRRD